MNKTERNFWLDVIIFVALLLTAITGCLLWLVVPYKLGMFFLGISRNVWLSAHICSALVGLVGIVTHVVWHQDWLKALRGCPLRGLQGKLRANRIVNRIIWFVFIASTVFGAMSWAFHLGDNHYYVGVPDHLHVVFGVALVITVTVHLALHWKWIALTTRRYIQIPMQQLGPFNETHL
jgi:hypothetical protein